MACRLVWTNAEILLMHKFQWKLKRNSYIFIQENALKNVVCEIASILSRLQCVKLVRLGVSYEQTRICEIYV